MAEWVQTASDRINMKKEELHLAFTLHTHSQIAVCHFSLLKKHSNPTGTVFTGQQSGVSQSDMLQVVLPDLILRHGASSWLSHYYSRHVWENQAYFLKNIKIGIFIYANRHKYWRKAKNPAVFPPIKYFWQNSAPPLKQPTHECPPISLLSLFCQ